MNREQPPGTHQLTVGGGSMETKQCLNCPIIFPKRKTESYPRWKSRKYCSDRCAKQYQKKHRIGLYASGKMTIKVTEATIPIPHNITGCNEFTFKKIHE